MDAQAAAKWISGKALLVVLVLVAGVIGLNGRLLFENWRVKPEASAPQYDAMTQAERDAFVDAHSVRR